MRDSKTESNMQEKEPLPPIDTEPSFQSLREQVKISTRRQIEFSIKILKRADGTVTQKILPGEREKVSFFLSGLNLATKPGEICLTTHTHYISDSEGFKPQYSLLYSNPDLDQVFLAEGRIITGKEAHLGSFFIPSPFGVSFIIDAHRFSQVQQHHSSDTLWSIVQKDHTETELGWMNHIDVDKIDHTEPISLRASSQVWSIALDVLFLPNTAIDHFVEQGVNLEQVLFGSSLPALTTNSHFEPTNHQNMLDVIAHTKNLVREALNKK